MLNKRFLIILSIFLVCFYCTALPSAQCAPPSDLPSVHIIENVPWHQQINGLTCGAGSLEIVFDYLGPDISQKEIANVARTSSIGTWTQDIVRAGHFSFLSSAMGSFYPHDIPEAGFEERPVGYAAFSHSENQFWLDELKGLIAKDIPVIVLMNYAPDGGGGHYRVVIGYDDEQGLIYFSDTWGRDLLHTTSETGVITWSYDDFEMGWNYQEYGTEQPYFGAVILPWTIEFNTKGKFLPGSVVTIEAVITYPCPDPMDLTLFPAEDVNAQIQLPYGMELADGSRDIYIGNLGAGESASVKWKVKCIDNVKGSSIKVMANGTIDGFVPDAAWAGVHNYYPAYDYTDMIGGEATLEF